MGGIADTGIMKATVESEVWALDSMYDIAGIRADKRASRL